MKDLIIVKSGVDYGVNNSDVAITDLANILTLKEGSVLGAFENGTVILATGASQGGGVAGQKSTVFYNRGDVAKSIMIDVATAKVISPRGSADPVAKVMEFDATAMGTRTEVEPTGVLITDLDRPYYENGRLKYVDLPVDADTVLADYYTALAAKIAEHESVASAVNAAGTITITLEVGKNISLIGTGYLEGEVPTVTTDISFGDVVTTEEIMEIANEVQGSAGAGDTDFNGAPDLFKREWGIEDGVSYEMYAITFRATSGYPSNVAANEEQILYFAVPKGQLPAVGEDWLDILNALAGNIGDVN